MSLICDHCKQVIDVTLPSAKDRCLECFLIELKSKVKPQMFSLFVLTLMEQAEKRPGQVKKDHLMAKMKEIWPKIN